MTQQTRPPDNIVVIDDCSPRLPLDLLEPFPNVTLLSPTRGIGPEKILNNIIKATDYDAYMVQDADDWSTHDRLERSLEGAERTGAAMLGSHEFRVDVPQKKLVLCIYPPDVNRAGLHGIGHYLLHGTALISRELAVRVGGFDEKLKLGADSDFVNRGVHAGPLVNLPGFYGFRRVRDASLTTAKKTGYESNARVIEDRFMRVRGLRNLELARAGKRAKFFVEQKEPIGFIHHQGPELRLSSRGLAV
jgi:GT2 family glycosyltransferase